MLSNTADDKCWALSIGSNQYGQQMNRESPETNVMKLSMISCLHREEIDIQNIVTGSGGSCYILCKDGNLLVAGSNKYDELGITNQLILEYILFDWYKLKMIPHDVALLIIKFTPSNKILYLSTPILMNKSLRFQHKIKYISNGISSHHKFIINDKNALYAIGCNDYNQLGLDDNDISEEEDYSLLSFLKIQYFYNLNIQITKIECAHSYSIFLSETGDLFCCGYSRCHSFCATSIRPIFLHKIKDISCGYDHTLCLDHQHKLLSFGKNNFGQCGHKKQAYNRSYSCIDSKQETSIFTATLIAYFEYFNINIQSMCCGNLHSLCLDVNGNLYSFGCNIMGQIGIGIGVEKYYEPQLIKSLKNEKIINIQCGYNHNMAETDKNMFYLWGDNQYNQCLVYNDFDYVAIPTQYIVKQDFENDNNMHKIAMYAGYAETRVLVKYK